MSNAVQVNVLWLTFLISTVLPLVTALITNVHASDAVKAHVNLILSVITGVGTVLIQGKGSATLGQIEMAAFAAFIGSGTSYNHLWKQNGVVQAVAGATAGIGIGRVKPVVGGVIAEPPRLAPEEETVQWNEGGVVSKNLPVQGGSDQLPSLDQVSPEARTAAEVVTVPKPAKKAVAKRPASKTPAKKTASKKAVKPTKKASKR